MGLKEKLSAIQREMKAPKNLYNSFGKYNYRNAESILEAFKPFEEKYKVCMTINDSIEVYGDRVYVKAEAVLYDCESAEVMKVNAYAREAQEKKGMDDSQVTGATSSYARKYALNGLFLLDDTKDADSDEYAKQTSSKGKAEKPQTQAKEAPKEEEKPTPAEIEKLENLCIKDNVDRIALAMAYKKNDITELNKAQYENLIKNWAKAVAKFGLAKD